MFCGPVKSWAYERKTTPQAHGKREKASKIEVPWAWEREKLPQAHGKREKLSKIKVPWA